ncbi:MAG: siderophore-interacting protein [Pseudomonadota bacterium]
MPRLNKWMADGMEKLFQSQFRPVEVSDTTYFYDRLKRVRFQGDLSGASFTPGNVIEFRINDEEFRHYTPADLDVEQGTCEVLFYLHDLGPGSRWAEALAVGASLNLMGPGRKMSFRTDAAEHLLFGDESSLGLALSFARAAATTGTRCRFLLELDDANKTWPDALGLSDATVFTSSSTPGAAASQWVEDLDDQAWHRLSAGAVYLTGQAASIQRLYQRLKKRGLSRQRIQSTPYWSAGKSGL